MPDSFLYNIICLIRFDEVLFSKSYLSANFYFAIKLQIKKINEKSTGSFSILSHWTQKLPKNFRQTLFKLFTYLIMKWNKIWMKIEWIII